MRVIESERRTGRARATTRGRPSWWPALVAVGRAEPLLAVGAALTALVSAVAPAVFILLSGYTASLLSGGDAGVDTGRLTLVVGSLAVVLAFAQLIGQIRSSVLEALARQMDIVLRRRLIEAVARPAGAGHLEDPAVQGQIATAHGLANRLGGPAGGLLGVSGRLQVLLTGLGSAALLVWVDVGLGVTLTVVTLATGWWLRAEYRALLHDLHLDAAALRRSHYLRDLLLHPGAEKETRVFGLGTWFLGLHDHEWRRVAMAAWHERRVAWWKIAAGAVLLGVAQAASFAVLAHDWSSGQVTLARLVIGVQSGLALLQLATVTEWDRLAHIGWEAVDALLAVEAAVAPLVAGGGRPSPDTPRDRIEVRDVGFAYPDGTEVLHGVSLTIQAGRSYALVGRNGAGKSTLLKLLMRDHEPTAGEIVVDGVPLASLDADVWRSRLSTMTQDAARLPLSLQENITGPGHQPDLAVLNTVAAQTGLDSLVPVLSEGWDTVLSRQIKGGTELSGGQWQKVALARALYALRRGARVLALDEPTANMDIETERGVYDAILDATHDQTVILVSHRFATVRRVDHIVVLDGGRIVESGDHAQLMAQAGLYSRMFEAQAAIVR